MLTTWTPDLDLFDTASNVPDIALFEGDNNIIVELVSSCC